MPKVLNYRSLRGAAIPPNAVWVDRRTAFGNPFKLGKSREVALVRFRTYLDRNPALVTRIKRELKGKDLVCWCAPKPCHADILLEIANG